MVILSKADINALLAGYRDMADDPNKTECVMYDGDRVLHIMRRSGISFMLYNIDEGTLPIAQIFEDATQLLYNALCPNTKSAPAQEGD